MDWAGRRWGNILMAIPATAGWILLAMAGPLNMNNPWTFYMGRTLTGKKKKKTFIVFTSPKEHRKADK